MLCASLLGIPILRLRGHYFAIATLGLSAAMAAIFANLAIAGANIGLVLPLTRADACSTNLRSGCWSLCTLTVAWMSSSRFGMALIAIREDEDAADVMGVNTTLYKVLALVLSALFTALAGGIHAYWITFIDPASAFDLTLNVQMVIMAVFGGPGTVFGPVDRRLHPVGDLRVSLEQHLDRGGAVLRHRDRARGGVHAEGPHRPRRRHSAAAAGAISCGTSGRTGYERRRCHALLDVRGLTPSASRGSCRSTTSASRWREARSSA